MLLVGVCSWAFELSSTASLFESHQATCDLLTSLACHARDKMQMCAILYDFIETMPHCDAPFLNNSKGGDTWRHGPWLQARNQFSWSEISACSVSALILTNTSWTILMWLSGQLRMAWLSWTEYCTWQSSCHYCQDFFFCTPRRRYQPILIVWQLAIILLVAYRRHCDKDTNLSIRHGWANNIGQFSVCVFLFRIDLDWQVDTLR